MIRFFVSAALVAGLLSACVTPQTPAEPASVGAIAERQQKLQALGEFSFSGGMGIWTDDESISARIRWQQVQDRLTVDLTGPLGVGDFQLQSDDEGATLTRGDTIVASGESADVVLQRGLSLSAPIPVDQLKLWVVGLPGDATSAQSDSQGKLSSLQFTDGQGTRWQARFLKYTMLDELQVPSLITASGGPYSVRMVLRNWQSTAASDEPAAASPETRLAIPSQ